MKFIKVIAASALAALLLATAATAAEPVKIRVGGLQSLHGLPTWENMRNGSLAKENLDVSFKAFTSGSALMESFAAGQWDVGSIGTIPAMLAGLRYKAVIIAITSNDSKTNDIWVRPDSPLLKNKGANPKFPEIYGTADDWRGKKILCATMTNGHYVLSSTLKALGLADKDVNIVQVEQGQAMTAFSVGEGDIIQLFAPNNYIGEERGWKRVSSGYDAGVVVPSVVFASKDFAEKHPEALAAWLDLYLRVYDLMRTDKAKALDLANDFFVNYCGMPLNKEFQAKDFQRKIFYTAEENYQALSDPAQMQAWMQGVAKFMVDGKRISQKEYDRYIENKCFVEPKFLKMVLDRRAKEASK